MAVTGQMTVREFISEALYKIGVTAIDETPEDDYLERGRMVLNRMLKGWQNKRYFIWTLTDMTVIATATAVQTIDPVRPIRITSARLRRSGIDTPMQEMTRQEYDDLPQKLSTGLPTTYYYDRQREDAVFYVWPVLATANGETIEITYERELEDADNLDANIDLPGEWLEAGIYGLAARLSDDFTVSVPKVDAYAASSLQDALGADVEGSVYWGRDY